jgi:hypothetical protein
MKPNGKKQFKILKESGYPEPFSKEKLTLSLERTGLPKKECERICEKVSKEISEGANTRDIYKKALKLLKQSSPIATVHYSLKKSLFALGPEGHYFEIFVSKYFNEIGFKTQTRKTLMGKFVKHEIDVIADLEGKQNYIECKFHNHAGLKNDVKISLYVKARWDDLKDGPEGKCLRKFYIASNTAFTEDAITYAKGTGLNLLGINMPQGDSFLDKIKKLKLYPITSLRLLPKSIKKVLLQNNIILAKDLITNSHLLTSLGMREEDITVLREEIELLTLRGPWK